MMNRSFNQHIAVRAYAIPKDYQKPKTGRRDLKQWPTLTLIFDCSTSPNESDQFAYGSYLVVDGNQVVDKGFFYDENIDQKAKYQLKQYVISRNKVVEKIEEELRILPKNKFIKEVFLKVAHEAKGVVVGFRLPSQFSHIAVDWAEARAKGYEGGFSFTLLNYIDKDGCIKPDSYTPRIAIKAIDGRRARIGFTSSRQEDPKPNKETEEEGWGPFRGHFVDCRTLAFALAGQYFDIKAACDYFSVESSPVVEAPGSSKTQTII